MSCFRFQQFEVEHDRSSMKVGTDAVLLGAVADLADGKAFLEIGCGCGVISLMLAQRFPEAHFLGIDLHAPSIEEALLNFRNSPFSGRLQAQLCRLQDLPPAPLFDGILSNPPFFRQSSKCPNSARSAARHDVELDLPTLFYHATALLSEKGSLQLIIPSCDLDFAEEEAAKNKLYLHKQYDFYARNLQMPKRSIVVFQKQKGRPQSVSIPLHDGPKASAEYQKLLGNFLTIYQSK